MKAPEYYIQGIELDLEPNLTDVEFGAVSLDFEVDDTPEYDDDLQCLKFESGIELELQCYPNPLHDSNKEAEEKIGNVESKILVVVEGAEEEFAEFISTWEEEGYRETEWDFRYHIESGYISEVFAPISSLIENSFRGVLPGLAFTEPPTSDQSELPVERTEFLRQYLQKNIQEELINYFQEVLDVEIDEEDIQIQVNTLGDIEVGIADELSGEYEQENINQIISEVFARVVREEADEEIESISIELAVENGKNND